jgi:YD repeat-containing protein
MLADKHPNTARGFDIGKPYQMNGIDNINMFNLNLTITIPIGQRYHVNGNLQYGLTLVYSGNSWDTLATTQDGTSTTYTVYPNARSNAGLGWLVSLGRLFPPNQHPTLESHLWNYETPDGALHAFHASLHEGHPVTEPATCGLENARCFTRDGSYLRMTTAGSDHTIEFPDGTMHVFREVQKATDGAWSDVAGTGIWRLREIRDRFGNSVSVSYSANAAGANPEIWTIQDGTRTQTVYFNNGRTPTDGQSPYDALVDRIVLATFGQTTAEWKPTYNFQARLGRGGAQGTAHTLYLPTSPTPYYANVPLLATLTLPPVNGHSQVYSMLDASGSPEYVVGEVYNPLSGVIKRLHLPTGGALEWDTVQYTFAGSSDEGIKRAIGVTARRMVADGHTDTWTYRRSESAGRTCTDPNTGDGKTGNPEQLVTSVTAPEGTTSVHYFSIFPDGSDPCGGTNFQFMNYGLPFTQGVSQAVGVPQTTGAMTAFLSQETYTGTPPSLSTSPTQYRVSGETRVRSEWATYDVDTEWEGAPDVNSREASHVTLYEDDTDCTGCYSAVSRYSFDGAGHFRQSSTRSNFAPDTAPAGNYVTAFTNYNQVDPAASAWLLNRFTEQCKVEDSVARPSATTCADLASGVPVANAAILSGPHVEHFCFDSNGFLTRHRKLAGAVPASNDLVSVYTGTSGNVTQEDYYGGDTQNVMPTTNFCTASLSNPAYSVAHTYLSGALATSKYLNLPSPGFLITDNTIDANSGLVSSSRDTTGLQTAYLYDALGRVTKVTPPLPEVPTTYAYAEVSAPFTVTAERASASGTIQSITEFDGLGRVSKEKQTLPNTITSRVTTYTGSGWINSVSQWEGTPTHSTTYAYDPFGRPLTITAPDASTNTLQYFGTRKTTRTIRMGTTLAGTVVSQTPTTTTETYDAQGRISNLHDAAGNDTTYAYDVSGHLTGVSMGVQSRLFTYDGRGLLLSEQHPELNGATGQVSYGGFDARGHAGTKLLGSSLSDFDLAYTYDAAERLRQIDQITARTPLTLRPLKTFTFGTAGSATGKLAQDLRHSYRGADDFKVTQDYTYRSSDGKLTAHQTTIDKGTTRLQQFTQSYDYTDIGALATLTYPTCPDAFRPCGASSLSSVSPVFSKGMLTSLPGFVNSFTYHDDGTVNQVAHPGSITDTYEADDHAMGRPKSIAFEYYDVCTPPSGVTIGRTPAGSLMPQTAVQLTATPTSGYTSPITYQWYRVVNSAAVPIIGATLSTFSESIAATTTYRVRVGNGCGGRDSADVTVPVCPSITTQPASQSASPATLTVTATGCGTLSYQWYQLSGGSNVAVGTNSATYSTDYLGATTTFWVKVTDSQNGATASSNNAVVTANACLPQITEDLHDQAVDYGQSVSVHVTVSGCTGKTYHWYSGQAGDTSTPLWGGVFDGSPNINNAPLDHGPIWVRVDGDVITPVNSRTAMISVRPVSVNAVITPNMTNQITVTWQAKAAKYRVKRCANGVCDAPFLWPGGLSYSDPNRTVDTTYVYSIASVDTYGNESAFSNPDIATTMTFTPVISGGTVSRTHINELLKAVNLLLAAKGAPLISWPGILPSGVPAPPADGQPTTAIYAAHITSLRTQMDNALSLLGIPLTPYTDPLTLTVIKAVHFTDLQARIR